MMMMRKRLYLDNNADTEECEASALARRAGSLFGNPSSAVHEEGRRARRALEAARAEIARMCGAPAVVFTSGATESNHLAITAAMNSSGRGRVVTTGDFEHPSVGRVAAAYEPLTVRLRAGTGEVELRHLRELCAEPDVGMASVILAHNELGVVQDQAGLRDAVLAARRDRESESLPILHLDATQLIGKARFSLAESGADLASWSAHKFHGPPGAGGLLMASAGAIAPYPECCAASGDPEGQEMGLRAGTENVPGAVGAAAALREAVELGGAGGRWARTRDACDRLAARVVELCPAGSVDVTARPSTLTANPRSARLCNTVHLCFRSLRGVDVARALDDRGVAVSTGSACSRSAPSRALLAAGLSPERVRGSVRVTASAVYCDPRDLEAAAAAVADVVAVMMT